MPKGIGQSMRRLDTEDRPGFVSPVVPASTRPGSFAIAGK
jgi:hypothetical protein